MAVLPTVWLPDVELTYGRYQTRLSLTGIDPVESGTREIGIMKVIGASVNDVKQLFLLEAGSIGFIGGTIGLGVGWSGA